MLFTLVSILPRKTILVAAILPIAASFLALYSGISIAWHIFGPTSFSVSQMRLESGSSIAIFSVGLLFLAHSVSVRTRVMGGTEIEIPQHEVIPCENAIAQGIPLHAKEEKKRCPYCAAEVPLESLICPNAACRPSTVNDLLYRAMDDPILQKIQVILVAR